MRRALLGAVTIAIACASATAARAQDTTASLGWVRLPGAETCPSAQAIARATETLLGRGAFVPPAAAALAIEGRAEPIEGGFRATLTVSDARGASVGERVVEARGACDALLSPLSIVLAILVDPDAQPTPPTPPPPPPPERVVETRIVTERVEVEVPAPPWRLELDLGAVLALGATPFVSGGGELFVFLTPPSFVPIGVHGWIVPFSRAELAMGAHVDQLASWAGLTVCPLAGRDETLSFAICGGLDVGAVLVVGSEGASVAEHDRVTGGLDLSARGRVHAIGPLWIALSAALLVPFRTEAYRLTSGAPYDVPDPVALIVTVGPTIALDL